MKILQLIQKQQYRGAEVFSSQLSNHLVKLGHQVELVSIFPGHAQLPFTGETKTLGRKEHWKYADFTGWRKLAELIASFKPDVVQANAADTLKYAVLSRLLHGWKAPIVYRNASSPSFYIRSAITKAFNSFLLKQVDLILSVSEASKRDMNETFACTREKTFVLPVGVEKCSLEESRKLSDKVVLHVASFTKEKNHFELIRIFQRVLRDEPGAVLQLVGEGPLFKNVRDYVREQDLVDKVEFLGAVDRPLKYVKSANVVVLPSKIEGLPGILLEAMSCKVPVVAYDVGGIREILPYNSGSLVKSNDSATFSEKLRQALKNPDREEIENLYQMIQQNYLNSDLALKFVNYYKKLVASAD